MNEPFLNNRTLRICNIQINALGNYNYLTELREVIHMTGFGDKVNKKEIFKSAFKFWYRKIHMNIGELIKENEKSIKIKFEKKGYNIQDSKNFIKDLSVILYTIMVDQMESEMSEFVDNKLKRGDKVES